jgi:hypothetical protein
MLTRRGYGGRNGHIYSEEWYYTSSTNSRHIVVLFRIHNPTASAITWTLYFYYTSYGSWGESASVALNGVNQWTTTATCQMCTRGQSLSIPPGRTSSVFVMVGSGYGYYTRTLVLAFYNNCLRLPTGLEYVDDLPTATGGYEA